MLPNLTNAVVSSANIEAHSRIVLQKFIQRELIRISGEIIGDAYEDSTDVFDMLDDAESKLFEITNNHLRKNFDSIDTVLVKTIQRIEDMRNRAGRYYRCTNRVSITRQNYLWMAANRFDYSWRQDHLWVKQLLHLTLPRSAALHPTQTNGSWLFQSGDEQLPSWCSVF